MSTPVVLSDFNAAFRVVSLVLSIVSVVSCIVCAVLLFIRRKYQPIAARSGPVLMSFWWGIFGLSVYWVIKLFDSLDANVDDFYHCILLETWFKGITQNILVFAILLMCLRLFLMYSVAKRILSFGRSDAETNSNNSSREGSDDETNNPIIKFGSRLYHPNTILKMLLICFIIVILLSVIATIYYYAVKQICSSGFLLFAAYLVTGGSLILILIHIGLLWNVHDAYLLKKEMKGIAIIALVISVPGFVLANFASVEYLGTALRVLFFLFVQIPTFLMPIVESYTMKRPAASTSISISMSEVESGDGSVAPAKKMIPFASYPIVLEYLSTGPIAESYLNIFIVDIQHMDASKLMLFLWKAFAQKKQKEDIPMLSKSTLLFQEFFRPDSYLPIGHLFDPALVKEVQTTIDAYLEEVEDIKSYTFDVAKLTPLFDPFIAEAEKILVQEIFEPFFRSDFYTAYQKRGGLNVALSLQQQQ